MKFLRTVCFPTKGFGGLTHEDILASLKEIIKPEEVEAIQLTERDCRITLKTEEAKIETQIKGLNLKDRYVKPVDSDKTITNVTIKDAPYELKDQFIVSSLMKYGQVTHGSMRPGRIKGTDIANGTRYCQMTDVQGPIPCNISLGDYDIRVYCDNNKTKCKYCNSTGHPYYRCGQHSVARKPKACFKCGSTSHLIRSCTAEQENQEILHEPENTTNEPQTSKEIQEEIDSKSAPVHESTPKFTTTRNQFKVIFGASNWVSAHSGKRDTIIVAKSGAMASGIEELFAQLDRDPRIKPEDVVTAVIHLGTNDIKNKNNDADLVVMALTNAVEKTREHFPDLVNIGISSIPPKRGSGAQTDRYNEAVNKVNNFMSKFCKQTSDIQFIDNSNMFKKSRTYSPKSVYNLNDQTCIHLNGEGIRRLLKNFEEVIDPPDEFWDILKEAKTRNLKRNRSEVSDTPPSAEKQAQKKCVTDVPGVNFDDSYH